MDQRSARRSFRPSIGRGGIIKPRKRFGQNFLVDRDVIGQIHDVLAIQNDDRVVEIGPGRGALTSGLAAATSFLTLIELDRDLADQLRSRFPQATLHSADVLEVPLEIFADHRIVGNLPYNISTPLLFRVIGASRVVDMHFMLQKEVALRLTASPGQKAWGRLSVMLQYHCRVESLLSVGAGAFRPQPQVESMFVRITPIEPVHRASNLETYADVVKTAFLQRRKTLNNSLASFQIAWNKLPIDPTIRADHVSVADYVAIANQVDRA